MIGNAPVGREGIDGARGRFCRIAGRERQGNLRRCPSFASLGTGFWRSPSIMLLVVLASSRRPRGGRPRQGCRPSSAPEPARGTCQGTPRLPRRAHPCSTRSFRDPRRGDHPVLLRRAGHAGQSAVSFRLDGDVRLLRAGLQAVSRRLRGQPCRSVAPPQTVNYAASAALLSASSGWSRSSHYGTLPHHHRYDEKWRPVLPSTTP